MSWTEEVPSFPPVPIDELYSNAKKWAEKGEWKKQKDLAIKKAISIVTCMVQLTLMNTAYQEARDGSHFVSSRPACIVETSTSVDLSTSRAQQETVYNLGLCDRCGICRTAACCLTRYSTWNWVMLSTSAMLEVHLLARCSAFCPAWVVRWSPWSLEACKLSAPSYLGAAPVVACGMACFEILRRHAE